jgi:hypothetical protein
MGTTHHIYRPSERVSNCVDKLTIAMLKQGILRVEDELKVRQILQVEILRCVIDIQNDTFANSTIYPSPQIKEGFNTLGDHDRD